MNNFLSGPLDNSVTRGNNNFNGANFHHQDTSILGPGGKGQGKGQEKGDGKGREAMGREGRVLPGGRFGREGDGRGGKEPGEVAGEGQWKGRWLGTMNTGCYSLQMQSNPLNYHNFVYDKMKFSTKIQEIFKSSTKIPVTSNENLQYFDFLV